MRIIEKEKNYPKILNEGLSTEKRKWMIWQKQGTSPNRLLCFSDVIFMCQGKLGEFIPASKIASTFLLALIEEKSTPLNFLYFSTQLSGLKILAKQSKTAKKMLAFHCWIIQLGESKGLPQIKFCVLVM